MERSDPIQFLKEAIKELSYNPLTGGFKRKGRTGKLAVGGAFTDQGYVRIRVAGRTMRAHRLAWLFIYGEWPDGEIDHIDGDRKNNRANNLRVADRLMNSNNRHKAIGESGVLGVHYREDRDKWRARVTVFGEYKHLGYFDTPEEAKAAYDQARKEGWQTYKNRDESSGRTRDKPTLKQTVSDDYRKAN